MAAQRQHRLFTLELLLTSGCEDNPQTRQMVDTLNGISRLWGREVLFYLEKIVNAVKSKSDELKSVLDFGLPSFDSQPAGSQHAETLEIKIKKLEDENKVLLTNSKEMEAIIASSQTELAALRTENVQLKQPVQEKMFRSFLKSYNSRCVELDSQKYETSKLSMWYNEQLLAIQQTKTILENNIGKKDQHIEELKSKLINESLQVNINLYQSDNDLTHFSAEIHIREFDRKGQRRQVATADTIRMHKFNGKFIRAFICVFITPFLTLPQQTFVDPIDKTTAVCPVPMSNGYLISLKHVYNSWKMNGVKHTSTDWNTIPPFKLPDSTDNLLLAHPDQILLIHHITLDIGVSAEPPFKVQYNLEGQDGFWRDIMLTDQIRIASVMYQMKHIQPEVGKISKHCLVQKNQFLVEVTLEQQVFAFKIKEAESNPMKEILSRLIVSDSSYELF